MNFFEKVGLVILTLSISAAICLLTAVPVYYLWNWLMPDIFALPEITYWQSFGITILCNLLFKSHVSKND